MADPEDKPAQADRPEWQKSTSQEVECAVAAEAQAEPDQLEVARRFLEDDDVRTASRDKKVEFLKSKGIQDDDIQKLLEEKKDDSPSDTTAIATIPPRIESQSPKSLPLSSENDRPPVVTYPEFLAKPARPPPLVTTNGLLATLYGFAGASALLYGASKLVLAPMVESLTDARSELHGVASHKLDALVAKLERTVSEIPASAVASGQVPRADDMSDAEDPTEMFHRDIGTQTSLPTTPAAGASTPARSALASESDRQADRLSEATKSLSGLKDQLRSQSEDLEYVRTLLDVFRDDVDRLTYASHPQYASGYDRYGSFKKTEPEDEIRKVRDNIRRVKGILLSTRSFPASTR